MALEPRSYLAIGEEFLSGEETSLRQSRVESGAGVALGHDEAIPVGPSRVLWAKLHDAEVEGCEDVCAGERASHMCAVREMRHPDDITAEPPCLVSKDIVVNYVQHHPPIDPLMLEDHLDAVLQSLVDDLERVLYLVDGQAMGDHCANVHLP